MTPRRAAAGLPLFAGLVLTACEAPPAPAPAPSPPALPSAELAPVPPLPPTTDSGSWRSITNGAGIGLTYADGQGRPVIILSCAGGDLRVSVPGFRKVDSEDRLTVGAGDEAFALVADLASSEPGVVAGGPIPPDLVNRLSRRQPVSAIYGAQKLASLPGPDVETSRAFVSGCRAR